jgi:WD40 repeat protein
MYGVDLIIGLFVTPLGRVGHFNAVSLWLLCRLILAAVAQRLPDEPALWKRYPLQHYVNHTAPVQTLSLLPSDYYLLSGSASPEGSVVLWGGSIDLDAWAPEPLAANYGCNGSTVVAVAWAPPVGAGLTGLSNVWAAAACAHGVVGLMYSADNNNAGSGSYAWAESFAVTLSLGVVAGNGNGVSLTSVSWHSSSQWLAVLDGSSVIWLFGSNSTNNVSQWSATPQLLLNASSAYTQSLTCMAWAPVGGALAVAGASLLALYNWDPLHGLSRTPQLLVSTTVGHGMAWSPDGSWLAVSGSPLLTYTGPSFELFGGDPDVSTWQAVASGSAYAESASVCWSPFSPYLVASGSRRETSVSLWSSDVLLDNGGQAQAGALRLLTDPDTDFNEAAVTALAFSGDVQAGYVSVYSILYP